MVRVFDNSYRNYRADQRERANEFGGWNIHDKFKRPMGSLGAYLANQEPQLTGNEQYEDSFGHFGINDVPSGIELYDAIRCFVHGILTGYFRKFPGEQVIAWKKCCKVHLCDMNGVELDYEGLAALVNTRFHRFDLSHLTVDLMVKIDK